MQKKCNIARDFKVEKVCQNMPNAQMALFAQSGNAVCWRLVRSRYPAAAWSCWRHIVSGSRRSKVRLQSPRCLTPTCSHVRRTFATRRRLESSPHSRYRTTSHWPQLTCPARPANRPPCLVLYGADPAGRILVKYASGKQRTCHVISPVIIYFVWRAVSWQIATTDNVMTLSYQLNNVNNGYNDANIVGKTADWLIKCL